MTVITMMGRAIVSFKPNMEPCMLFQSVSSDLNSALSDETGQIPQMNSAHNFALARTPLSFRLFFEAKGSLKGGIHRLYSRRKSSIGSMC